MPGHKRKSMGDDDMKAIAKMEKGGIVKMMKGGRVGYKKGGLVHDLQKLEAGGKSESFPDLTGDGKVTYADILKGRGVKKK
tara:strand:+ start:1969 stop:2211 length:243 start_codon:yes stop_codon:yes gene_type:complete